MAHKIIHNRFKLREIKENDWKDIHIYTSQSIVCQYQTWGPNSETETKEFVNQVLQDARKVPRNRFSFAVVELEYERVVGAGEITIRDLTNRVGEIGYNINPDYWGKGLATEVARKLITFGFKELNLHRIFATCDPRNIGSIKVLEKNEMTKEGRIRECILLKDGWRDSFLYSILEQEWKEMN
ncbi:GNAT family N-acetyltransferase [Bacillus thuringiensis]|uniref:GNAT family N-acetyltransferase n=1 Tax=Bacillus thuringiensis TaxID=1428 RepID=UPI000BFE307C|nr:GNAT family protein [Bacillus thuringiensis]PGQ50483.1 GNAT family N-acetyltransferase [Bacillus thuringiensis]